MTVTVGPRPRPATTTAPSAPTTTPATTAATASARVESVESVESVDGVDHRPGTTTTDAATRPVGSAPSAALVTDADLTIVEDVASALARATDAAVAGVFAAARAAGQRVARATSVEIPLRLAITTGKGQAPRLPQDVPGMLKERGGSVTFYPADESLKPFEVSAEAARHLPKDTVLVARATKRSVEIALPDGTAEKASVYALRADGIPAPRRRFTGIIDFVAGEPFVRDLIPPPRLVALPDTQPGGTPWVEGAIVDVAVEPGAHGPVAEVLAELAPAGSPKARTWMIAAGQRLDAVFPDRCMEEASAIAAAQATSLADDSLVDLTDRPFFAIDNPGSTDIDQAMHLEKRADGGYTIFYALADASHYIRPGMALFEEAMQRGASYYLPGLSIPMLPPVLSEGVISLNAHEDHRALVLRISLDKDGNVEGPAAVLRAKIHSQAQLTYGGVSALLTNKKPLRRDEHGKPVPRSVIDQLAIFREIGERRIAQARARGVVEPERRELVIGVDRDRFYVKDSKADFASKLNAEFSILANVAGAEALKGGSKIPGLPVPGIFRTHREPSSSTYEALSRQIGTIVRQHKLPARWRWNTRNESLAAWVERVKTLPKNDRERALALVLQMAAVRINVASEYERTPGAHSGLKVDGYGRFSAPMREQVGVVSHAVLFAKDALERAFDAAPLTVEQAKALWAPLLLGALVPPDRIPLPRRELAAATQELLTATPAELPALAQKLAAQAVQHGPGLTSEEQALIDDVMNRAMRAGNNGKLKQSQVDSASLRLLFDDLFLEDLGGNPLGSPHAPKRAGVVTAVTPGKVYVQLKDPDVEVRLSLDDVRRHCPNAAFRLEEEGCALVSDDPSAGAIARLFVGAEITVQATHHDGERLHFAIVA